MFDYLDATITMATPGEGRTLPIWPQAQGSRAYRPHLRLGGGELLGVAFVDGPALLRPGEQGAVTLALIYAPTGVDYTVLQPAARFDVVDGPNIVARGQVMRRYQLNQDWRASRNGTA